MRGWRYILLVILPVALPLLGGCEINPETGKLVFNVVSPDDEKRIGAKAHRQVLAEFGGVYYDPPLAAYVDDVGQKLVEHSRIHNFNYDFTILDSPNINAFALPGGYIYVTRGLLALLSNEAELAAVLGHEIAHVTAKHGAQRLTWMKAEQRFCATFICDFELPLLNDTASVGLDLAFGGFTQDQELEADRLGMRYMHLAGYDPGAMTSFLEKLKAQTDLESEIAGLTFQQRKARGYSSTHPLTEDRLVQAKKVASHEKAMGDAPAKIGKRDYLLAIDGLLYGNRREYGFVRGHTYEQPIRRVAFDVPSGYTLYPDSRRVTAVGPDGAIVLFEPSRRLVRGSVLEYLTTIWAEGANLEDAHALDINGMEAATAWMRRQTKRGPVDYRLVAVRVESGVVYRFLFISPSAMTEKLSVGMRTITYSFRSLDESEAKRLQPMRIRVVTADAGDSLVTLASHSAFADHALQRFSVLNGLVPGSAVAEGTLLKTVAE